MQKSKSMSIEYNAKFTIVKIRIKGRFFHGNEGSCGYRGRRAIDPDPGWCVRFMRWPWSVAAEETRCR